MVAGLLSVSVTVEPARVLGLDAARSGTGSSTLTAWQGPCIHASGYHMCVLCHSFTQAHTITHARMHAHGD